MLSWELHPAYVGWLSVLLIGVYAMVAWQDLRRREIDLLPLLVLAIAGLVGHTAWWWIFLVILYAWPWRKETATLLIPALFVIGWVTGELAPVLALTAGILAWSLGWWGGADRVLLATLSLRYGLVGLVVGATTSALFGVLFLLARRQLLRLVPALTDVLAARNVVDLAAPPGSTDTEMPAATALGAAGLILEVWSWLNHIKNTGGADMTLIFLSGALAVATLTAGLLLLRKPAHTGILGSSLLAVGGATLTSLSFDAQFVGLWENPVVAVITLVLGALLAVVGATAAVLKLLAYRRQCREMEQRVDQLTQATETA